MGMITDNNMSDPAFSKTADDAIDEILGRYTITDLVEQSDESLARADDLFYKAAQPIKVIEQGQTNLIMWWRVESGGNSYEVRRFKNFFWCQCKSFFFSKRICKHGAFTTGVLCTHCGEMRAKVGKLCYGCDSNRKAVINRRTADAPRREL